MDELPLGLIAILVGAGAKTVVYAILLWIMVKLQGLNYTFFGLMVSSAVATAISFIPVAGPYLAYVGLLLCLRKVTQAEIFPDCAFTAVIANSLMFVVNLFLIGALMGSIRPDLSENVHARTVEEDDGTPHKRAFFSFGKSEDDRLLLRGVSVNVGDSPSAMISRGSTFSTIMLNETIAVRGPDGKSIFVKCEQITPRSVILDVNGTERVELELHNSVDGQTRQEEEQ